MEAPRMARNYAALTELLSDRPEATVELSFAELDELVQGLPPSARKHAAWWSNSTASQAHARSWLDAGRRASPSFDRRVVRFVVGDETSHSPRSSAGRHSSSLRPTGERIEAKVGFEWQAAGAVTLDGAGQPLFPSVPAKPGVYRLALGRTTTGSRSIYVGESNDVRRRMRNYRNPGSTQQTSRRVHGLLLEVLGSGGSVELAVAFDVALDGNALDLSTKPARLLAENAALVRAQLMGVVVENL